MPNDTDSLRLCDATDRELLASLRSGTCPACGDDGKGVGAILCGPCWLSLPDAFADPLRASLSTSRYRHCFTAAMLMLSHWHLRGIAPVKGGTREAD